MEQYECWLAFRETLTNARKRKCLEYFGSAETIFIASAAQIETAPFPGFATDMQAQMMALLTLARGTSVVVENVFENRMSHAAELNRMGADIQVSGRVAVVRGVEALTGAQVHTRDLRAGAALCIAALAAEGESVVENVALIDRGYDRLEEKLAALGGAAQRMEITDERR